MNENVNENEIENENILNENENEAAVTPFLEEEFVKGSELGDKIRIIGGILDNTEGTIG
jgi:transcription antitermination factor NusG